MSEQREDGVRRFYASTSVVVDTDTGSIVQTVSPLCVLAEDFDALKAQLAEAERTIVAQKALGRITLSAAGEHAESLVAAEARIRELEAELKNERASDIHSCDDQCQRPLCVAQRQVRELEALNAERNRQNAIAFGLADRMRAKLLELAGECAECGGRGFTSAPDPSDGTWHDHPCPDCADIREVAGQRRDCYGTPLPPISQSDGAIYGATAQQPAEGDRK